jgi:hypothetical protein
LHTFTHTYITNKEKMPPKKDKKNKGAQQEAAKQASQKPEQE